MTPLHQNFVGEFTDLIIIVTYPITFGMVCALLCVDHELLLGEHGIAAISVWIPFHIMGILYFVGTYLDLKSFVENAALVMSVWNLMIFALLFLTLAISRISRAWHNSRIKCFLQAQKFTYIPEKIEDHTAKHLRYACVICRTNEMRIICFPCGHLVYCGQCYYETRKRRLPMTKDVCPICSVDVMSHSFVYLP